MNFDYTTFANNYAEIREMVAKFHAIYFAASQELVEKARKEHSSWFRYYLENLQYKMEPVACEKIASVFCGIYEITVESSEPERYADEENASYSIPPEALEWPPEKIKELAQQRTREALKEFLGAEYK